MSRFDELIADMRREFRTFKLMPKERSMVMKAIYHGLLMFWWCPRFMSFYTTTIISVTYMPGDLIGTAAGYKVLRHERIHIRDCFRSGILPFVISYLFLLPAMLTLRSVWEMCAYAETMRVEIEITGRVSDATLKHIERQFTSSAYLWMCPFPGLVKRWLRRTLARVARATPAC